MLLHKQWTGHKKMPRDVEDYLAGMKRNLERAVRAANQKDEAKRKMKQYYDKGTNEDTLEEGDQVLLLHPAVNSGWKARWEGPYTVQRRVTPVTYRLDIPGRRGSVVHRNSLKRFIRTMSVNHVVLADGELDGCGLELPGLSGAETGDLSHKDQEARDALTHLQRTELDKMLEKNRDLFSTTPGLTTLTQMDINTKDSVPVNIHPYRIPVRWKRRLQEEIQNLLKLGIIVKSTSPWAAPVVCVAKPDGSLRLCIDYRGLNRVTSTDAYPMPRVEELVDRVAPAKFITTMDLCKGYYQVPLAEATREKTAFVIPYSKFHFCRMPFGLKNAPALFQRLMDAVLDGMERADAYIDDVVVASETWEQNLEDLKETFDRIRQSGLSIKRSKCVFGKAEVEFLGHRLGKGKVMPQAVKVEAINRFPRPVTKRDLRAFLGLTGYYHRFIPDFSSHSSELTDATAKDEHLKKALISDTLLAAFDPK